MLWKKLFFANEYERRMWCFMFHPIVKGSYYEMGYRYGTILYKHGFRVAEQTSEKLKFGRESEKEIKRIFPEILQETQGFAEACHASYDQLSALLMSIGAFKVEPMCSVFAVANDSDVLFGRNYDFFYSFKKYSESYLTRPKDGYISLGHSDIFIGREDGVNEKGLAIAMTGIAEKTTKPGVNFPIIIRCMLDKCASVEQAIKTLSDAHLSTTSNYLLADREGSMAVVEASPERVRIRRPEDNNSFVVCTNHFVHPEMQDMEDQKERSASNWDTIPRYTAICNALKHQKRKINIESAKKILADHSGYVCSHQEKIKLGTIWSIIATLKQLQVFRAEGHPCKTKYRQDLRLNKAIQSRNS
jgi:predicted choloylglycine hydrolase